jgi:hypothetical protein
VADVPGEVHRPYITFRDGWRSQEVIDAIRSGRGWYTLRKLRIMRCIESLKDYVGAALSVFLAGAVWTA